MKQTVFIGDIWGGLSMPTIVKKGIEVAIVVFSLIISFLFYKNLELEKYIKQADTPVTAAQIGSVPQESYTGRVAGEDITRISDSKDFAEMIGKDYATAEPVEVIVTGVYGLKPWVDPYAITKIRNSRGRLVSTGRKAPEVVDNGVSAVEYYQEYYLIRLEDGSCILAQFSDPYREKIEKGERVVLPIGIKKTNSNDVRKALEEICEEYGADNTFTLYMINDEWQKEHENIFFIIKLAIAAVVFFILAISLLVILYKLEDRH